ncbi:MAG: DUF1329 domain-containing protein [Alphaproteobacteria bacterium]|nr:DUF1329 domain-containing protein [Alphaproteobacteria bacterium]
MHIRKFGPEFTRRAFLEKAAAGVAMAGILSPLWPEIARSGTITKSYPDELLSIDAYTKGKIKTGDVINADNIDVVKDLVDPICYMQVKEMGRRFTIVPTTTDVTKLYPHEYLEATLSNQGKGALDSTGNVVTTDGKPWIGGNPFPDAKDGIQAFYNLVLSWGRHDQSLYAVRDWDISPAGGLSYEYDFVWVEQNTIGLVNGSEPYWAGHEDKLRYQVVWFTSPTDVKGTAFLNHWHYDQAKFPDLWGYLPAFKRVRRFPTNQRFEPLVPGVTFFLSDAWSAGDPALTWGNYKLVGSKPHLGSVSGNWSGGRNANWEREVHGGPQGQTFFEDYKELIPEVLVVEAEPTGFERAPVGKKRIWIDTRNMMFVAYVTFDRRGEAWKSFEPAFSQYSDGTNSHMDGGHPLWSWTHVHSHDVQTNRMSRFSQVRKISNGFESKYNTGPGIFDQYMTEQALRRLGA